MRGVMSPTKSCGNGGRAGRGFGRIPFPRHLNIWLVRASLALPTIQLNIGSGMGG